MSSLAEQVESRTENPAASDGHRARPAPLLPRRYRYTGRMPAWAWIAIFGLCIAAALPVIRTSSVTESGWELRALEAERQRLTSEIRSLAAHVGQLGSLARIQQQAQERFNMVPAQPTTVLEIDHAPPARTLPARFLPPADADFSVSSPGVAVQVRGGELDQLTARPLWRTVLDVLVFD